jgi:serine/threonine-protein kinase
MQNYCDNITKTNEGDLLVQYLQDNQHLLHNRPQSFTHGDWDTSNLIYTLDNQIGIIDLSGAKDYGDPWLDFRLTPGDLNQAANFYIGQINSYFDGDPPTEFFPLLAYYTALWALEYLCEPDWEGGFEYVKTVLNWFDNMRNPVPKWYHSQIKI